MKSINHKRIIYSGIFGVLFISIFSLFILPFVFAGNNDDIDIKIGETGHTSEKVKIPISLNFTSPKDYQSVAIAVDIIDPDLGKENKIFCFSPYRTSLFHEGKWKCKYSWPSATKELTSDYGQTVGVLTRKGKALNISNISITNDWSYVTQPLTLSFNRDVFESKDYRIAVGLWKYNTRYSFSCVGIPEDWLNKGVRNLYPNSTIPETKIGKICGGSLEDYKYKVKTRKIEIQGTKKKESTVKKQFEIEKTDCSKNLIYIKNTGSEILDYMVFYNNRTEDLDRFILKLSPSEVGKVKYAINDGDKLRITTPSTVEVQEVNCEGENKCVPAICGNLAKGDLNSLESVEDALGSHRKACICYQAYYGTLLDGCK